MSLHGCFTNNPDSMDSILSQIEILKYVGKQELGREYKKLGKDCTLTLSLSVSLSFYNYAHGNFFKIFLFVWISKQEPGASISGIKFKLLVSISTKFHHLLFLKYNCMVAGENQFFNHHSQSNLSNYHFNLLYIFYHIHTHVCHTQRYFKSK